MSYQRTIMVALGGNALAPKGEAGTIPQQFARTRESLDAVIDKDLTAAMLGHVIRARELWIITDIDYVYLRFKKVDQKAISNMTTAEAEKFLEQGEFGEGNMAPKIKAALYFLAHYGKKVVITSIPAIKQAIKGQAGTVIIKTEDRQS